MITSDLKTIPGVGPSIAEDLIDLGYSCVGDLRGQNAEVMYDDLCRLRRSHIDRCVLYVFRCAVYYAEQETPEKELLKWWNWKDSLIKSSEHGGICGRTANQQRTRIPTSAAGSTAKS